MAFKERKRVLLGVLCLFYTSFYPTILHKVIGSSNVRIQIFFVICYPHDTLRKVPSNRQTLDFFSAMQPILLTL